MGLFLRQIKFGGVFTKKLELISDRAMTDPLLPSRPSVKASPHRPNTWRAEHSRNIFFSLIEKISRAHAKGKIVKKMFLRGYRRSDSGGGRRGD